MTYSLSVLVTGTLTYLALPKHFLPYQAAPPKAMTNIATNTALLPTPVFGDFPGAVLVLPLVPCVVVVEFVEEEAAFSRTVTTYTTGEKEVNVAVIAPSLADAASLSQLPEAVRW